MARSRRHGANSRVRSFCLDAFLLLWVGGMMVRACAVLLAPIARALDVLAFR